MPSFQTPWWLPGAHLQTIVGHVLKGGSVPSRRERWDTPDGDFLDIDFLDEGIDDRAPTVLLIHGLGGNSDSRYIRQAAVELRVRGLAPVAMNCRGALGPNQTARLHHAGEWEDPAFVCRRLRERGPLGVIGFSLGASMTLNLLAREPAAEAAAVVSAPLDLAAGCTVLEQGFSRVYTGYLLNKLTALVAERDDLAAAGFDVAGARAARTIRQFDEALVAPLHGFADAADYYARSSAGPQLASIRTPTLVLRAVDDPFLARSDLSFLRDSRNPCVDARIVEGGGHVGFVDGSLWAPGSWAERTAASWLQEQLGT